MDSAAQVSQMKTIPLSRGLVAIVDDEDFGFLSQFKWCATTGRSELYYAVRNSPRGSGPRKHIQMHRLLCSVPEGFQVDHINGDSLDNRRSNLRPATNGQNNVNQGPRSNNKSGFRGVHWFKKTNRWRCSAGQKHIGYFKDPRVAAEKYNEEIVRLYGPYARPNTL